MEGWNGGRGCSWSYLHEIGSNVSSSSGTIASGLSTAYASSGSRFSTFSIEAAMHFDSLGIHDGNNGDGNNGDSKTWWWWWGAAEEDRMDRIRGLALEFFGAPPANCSIKRGDISAVERWLKELGVGWVLSLQGGASAGEEEELDRDARTWIRALDLITQTLCYTRPLFPDCASMGLPGICEEEWEPLAQNSVPDRYHSVLFIQETMLKMLTFVDVVVAWDPYTTEKCLSMDSVMLPPYSKLSNQLVVHNALSRASDKILTIFDSPTSVEVQRMENEIAILLSAYKSKAGDAIRSTMEKIRTMSMEDGHFDSLNPLNPQGSSDIHKVTQSIIRYIRFLCSNYSLVDAAICDKYVPPINNKRPFDDMIIDMVSCLQEKLASISESFPDQGLRFLFLLNNSYPIEEQLHLYSYGYSALKDFDLNYQNKGYMERYLQVSWAPLLSCLFNPTPLCLAKNYSPLSKFESEFQKIYTTQKLWKVPDPGVRRRLREDIIDKIIPSYTEYIEDNKVTNPKISPQELKAKLQELFEG